MNKFLRLVFHFSPVKVLPIIIIATIGFVLEICTTARNALTRDDVYYTRTAACDYIETRPGYHAPIRKLLVFNQKYEVPQDLTKALQGDPNGSSSDKKESNGVSNKTIATHAISSIGVLYLASVL